MIKIVSVAINTIWMALSWLSGAAQIGFGIAIAVYLLEVSP